MTVGEKIKKFRNELKLSQFDLELQIHSSTGSISRIENNIINPTKETLFKISDALKLSSEQTSFLFGIDDSFNSTSVIHGAKNIFEIYKEALKSNRIFAMVNLNKYYSIYPQTRHLWDEALKITKRDIYMWLPMIVN